MPGLAGAVATAAAAALASHHFDPPVAAMDVGVLHYDISAVNNSSGLGGSPPYCAVGPTDILMVTYRVTNRGDHDLPGVAAPRLVLIDPQGRPHPRDAVLSERVETKAMPFLSFPQHVLHPQQTAIQADVFVTARDATRLSLWRLRPMSASAMSAKLPDAKAIATSDCPRTPSPLDAAPLIADDTPAPKSGAPRAERPNPADASSAPYVALAKPTDAPTPPKLEGPKIAPPRYLPPKADAAPGQPPAPPE